MKRVNVICEGQTEESFVRELLAPYMATKNIFLKGMPIYGVSKYSVLKRRITIQCKSDKESIVTTMLDYYGLPSDTPGINSAFTDVYDGVDAIEECIGNDIGESNLIPNLIIHEFEGLLFSSPSSFEATGISRAQIKSLEDIKSTFRCPEMISNSYSTAPSRRIMNVFPGYNKVVDGVLVAKQMGLTVIRENCPHFDCWLKKIEDI